jgi:predicted N-acetyltransferase YhbS
MIETIIVHAQPPDGPPHGTPTTIIGDERETDRVARERLLDTAFGLARYDKTCQRLRIGRFPADHLALVARGYSGPIGTVRLWNIMAGDRAALLLGPLAVAASHRCCGIGTRLVEEALSRARSAGHTAIVLVGDVEYYCRFGFDKQLMQNLDLPGPVERHRLLGLELVPGALAGARGKITATGRLQTRTARLGSGSARRAA